MVRRKLVYSAKVPINVPFAPSWRIGKCLDARVATVSRQSQFGLPKLAYLLTCFSWLTLLHFYRTAAGRCPVEDFLDSLTGAVSRKVTRVFRVVEEANLIPTQYFKKLKDSEEIWECRVNYGSNTFRIFCFFASGNRPVLTHGFMKKTEKTPRREISRAEEYRKDYLSQRIKQE